MVATNNLIKQSRKLITLYIVCRVIIINIGCILCGNHPQLDLVCGRICKFSDFSLARIPLTQNLLEKLGEVFKNNFLIARYAV